MTWAEIQQSDDWKAFANNTVELIFRNLNSDAERVQTWLIVNVLKDIYPQLDVYIHLMKNNGGARTAIVFGRKNLQGNGAVCFELLQNNGSLPRLEPRQIQGIQAPNLTFTLADDKETITEKVRNFFRQETIYVGDTIRDRVEGDIGRAGELPNNRVRHLPLNFETGVC